MDKAYMVQALSPIRKLIAARMTEATQSIPHFRVIADIEVDALLHMRQELRGKNPGVGLSLNDFLVKACASALMDTPAINIQWVEGEIHQYRTADISIVTATKRGLSTPIIHGAESKSVWEISREVRALIARAARNRLKFHEVFGGSFSISNLGMHGVDQFDAIINSPQCAILAIGSAKPRAVVSPEREIRIATMLRVTLSVDHRAVDGLTAAAFLSSLRQRVEQPKYLRLGNGDS